MKRWMMTLLALVLFAVTSKEAQAASERYAIANVTTPLYDLRVEGEPYKIATLLQGAQVAITDYDDDRYYAVPWGPFPGQNVLYVAKEDVKVVNQRTYKQLATKTKETGRHFIPKRQVALYDAPSEKATGFIEINPTFRYPIVEKVGQWFVTSIGGRKGYIHAKDVHMDKGVPIVVYHHILKQDELGIYTNVSTTVTDAQFEEQMQVLASMRFQTISLSQLLSYMRGERMLPVRSAVLTFDDGLLSTKEYAYPVLKQHDFQATQYIISHRVEQAPKEQVFDATRLQTLSNEDLAQMRDVFTFEAHTYNLHNWLGEESELVTVSDEQLRQDLQQNIAHLGGATSFSYPFGRYTDETMEVVKELGFTSAVSTKVGYNLPGDDVYQLKRLGPTQQTTATHFKNMVLPYD